MANWSDFAAGSPALAASIRSAIYQYGTGLGFLATVRPDGGPRVHPVSPAIVGRGLYCCMVDSPKRRDLERDGRYALHTYPADDNDDEAGLRGWVRPVTDAQKIRTIGAEMRADPRTRWWLYEMRIEMAFLVRRDAASDGSVPVVTYQKWVDPLRGRLLNRCLHAVPDVVAIRADLFRDHADPHQHREHLAAEA